MRRTTSMALLILVLSSTIFAGATQAHVRRGSRRMMMTTNLKSAYAQVEAGTIETRLSLFVSYSDYWHNLLFMANLTGVNGNAVAGEIIAFSLQRYPPRLTEGWIPLGTATTDAAGIAVFNLGFLGFKGSYSTRARHEQHLNFSECEKKVNVVFPSGQVIHIKSDGSIDPPNAPIQKNGDSYFLTDDITADSAGIAIERDNVTLDGTGHLIQPHPHILGEYGINLTGRTNVTIQNARIRSFTFGTELITSTGNTITSNSFIGFEYPTILSPQFAILETGIWLSDSTNNTISQNEVTNYYTGVYLESSSNNKIYHNNFISTYNKHVRIYNSSVNTWNDDYPSGGNFWSNYGGVDLLEGPSQNRTGSDGIGDTPYIIDEYNIDRYPLMEPWTPQKDTTPPVTTISLSGLSGNNDWFTSDVTVTLFASDDISGVDKTEYSFDDAKWTLYTTPFNITDEGNTTIYYKSIDEAGNPEAPKTKTIKIDKTTPSGSISINDGQAYTTTIMGTLSLSATDAISGVAEMRFSNDNTTYTEWQPYATSNPWTLQEEDGTKIVYVQFRDQAGLISTYRDTIVLDVTPPIGFITIAQGAAYTNSTSVTLALSAEDPASGISQMCFSNDNVTWSDWETYATSKQWTLLAGDGAKSVTVQYRDNAGLISSFSDSIILDTTRPTANAGIDQTINEDTQATLDASASADENGISTYTWTFTDSTPQTLTGKNLAYTFTTPGTYTITLKASDPAGNYATDTIIITVLDVTKPTANAGSDLAVSEGTTITLDGSASSDNINVASYTWDFTDTVPRILTGPEPMYTFNTSGIYTVTLNVTDNAGNWATDTIVITVLDITKPIANAGQDQTVNVGTMVTFDAGGSADNVGIINYDWNFGDGATGAGKTATHVYTTAGTYNVTLTVKDSAGNSASDSSIVTARSEEVPSPPAEAIPVWIVGAIITIIGIAMGATLLLRRRK